MVTNTTGLSRCVGLFVFLAGVVWGQLPGWGQPPASATVPYVPKANGGQILVQVVLNGQYKATFALDTGCTWNMITVQMAKRMHLALHPVTAENDSPFLLNGMPVQGGEVNQFKLGEISLPKDLLVVDDKRSTIFHELHIDGLIGVNSFADKLLFIDPQRHQVSLWSAELTDTLRNSLVSDTPSVIQAHQGEDHLLYLPAHIEGKVAVDMAMDTGTGGIMVTPEIAGRVGKKPVETKQQDTISTFFGQLPTATILVDKFSFDTVSGSPVELLHVSLPYLQKDVDHYSGAHVGMGLFTFYRSLIDFKTQKVYLVPAIGNRSGTGMGIDVEIQNQDRVIITATTPGMSAEKAGLLSGDEVIKIDGKPLPHDVEALKTVLQSRFEQSPGSHVVLTVRRKGETKLRDVTVTFIKAQKPASTPSSNSTPNPAQTDTPHP